jgi:hypothetical protein
MSSDDRDQPFFVVLIKKDTVLVQDLANILSVQNLKLFSTTVYKYETSCCYTTTHVITNMFLIVC